MNRIEIAIIVRRLLQVIQKTGLSRGSIYERIKDSRLSQPMNTPLMLMPDSHPDEIAELDKDDLREQVRQHFKRYEDESQEPRYTPDEREIEGQK